jgi:hypothetical protein
MISDLADQGDAIEVNQRAVDPAARPGHGERAAVAGPAPLPPASAQAPPRVSRLPA